MDGTRRANVRPGLTIKVEVVRISTPTNANYSKFCNLLARNTVHEAVSDRTYILNIENGKITNQLNHTFNLTTI
jgi:hypothetical protein